MTIILIVAGIILLGFVGIVIFGNYRSSQIGSMSVSDMIAYDTKNDSNARITVGIYSNGNSSYTVYGKDGAELPQALHTYEIGSITKTFTASLIARAVLEGKLDIQQRINTYLPLPEQGTYPTIAQLLTHTSGYKNYYYEQPMTANTLRGRNSFYRVNRDMVLQRLPQIKWEDREYSFSYSNFGYAVLGLVLQEVYGQEYPVLLNAYVQETLGMRRTRVSDNTGDLGKYWDWEADDAYIAAGALLSDVSDMLRYAALQLHGSEESLLLCQKELAQISQPNAAYAQMGIYLDGVGMSWILDHTNNIIWHNGGTSYYNSYMGFDKQRGIAVVVLSNLAPNQKIPATVIGAKLLAELQA